MVFYELLKDNEIDLPIFRSQPYSTYRRKKGNSEPRIDSNSKDPRSIEGGVSKAVISSDSDSDSGANSDSNLDRSANTEGSAVYV